MGDIWLKEFTGGLDVRRLPETTAGGVLIRARNGHITRGGEFEKRKAFNLEYTLPAGTVGLAVGKTNLYVFGSAASAPAGLPADVAYQSLRHSDGTTALTRVLSADLYAGKLYVVGEFADGAVFHFYDGTRVTDWYDGRARATLSVISGTTSPLSSLNSLTVSGVPIIGAAVTWPGDEVQFATNLAAAINAYTSVPEYVATSNGPNVTIIASTPGAASNGRPVAIAVSNGLTLSGTSFTLANGSDQTAAYQPGNFVKTIGKKVYATSGPNMHFSGLQQPTKWKTDVAGAGFIDMSSETSGAEELTAVAKYQSNIAVFAEQVVQIWYVDPDPTLNRQSQVLNNTGTISGKSVTQYGDNDLFYLDESGIRSLRARDASNAAATNDVGVLIDPLVVAKLAELTFSERKQVVGLIEPTSGRFWLIMKDVIFVYSLFPGARVSAWTTYEPTVATASGVDTKLTIDGVSVFRRRVFIRSGNAIYAYGGAAGTVYDATEAEAWTPFLDAGTPTGMKELNGIDAALTGQWAVSVAMQPANSSVEDLIATLYETTYTDNDLGAHGKSTHFSLRCRTREIGPATLSSLTVHFTPDAPENQ